jgi:PIN domain nuclease of toxin-antitoxin system
MRVLLDTHAFVWWDNDELPRSVRNRIQSADRVYVSAASAWEVAIKTALGKITAHASFADSIEDYGFDALPITVAHADAVRALPPHHRDPFDRLLVAQAQIEGLALVSRDPAMRLYAVPVVWA